MSSPSPSPTCRVSYRWIIHKRHPVQHSTDSGSLSPRNTFSVVPRLPLVVDSRLLQWATHYYQEWQRNAANLPLPRLSQNYPEPPRFSSIRSKWPRDPCSPRILTYRISQYWWWWWWWIFRQKWEWCWNLRSFGDGLQSERQTFHPEEKSSHPQCLYESNNPITKDAAPVHDHVSLPSCTHLSVIFPIKFNICIWFPLP